MNVRPDLSVRYLAVARPELFVDSAVSRRAPDAAKPPAAGFVPGISIPVKPPEPVFVAGNWAVAGGIAGGVLGLFAGGLSGFGWGRGAGVGLAIGALGGGAAGLVSSVALTKVLPT